MPTQVQSEAPLLLTVKEAAKLLSVGTTKVYQLLNGVSGPRLYSVKLGNCRRIPRNALYDYLEKLTNEQR